MPKTQSEKLAAKAASARQYIRRPENHQKLRARDICNKAINRGKLHRLPCETCGTEKTQAHHDDYSKPLEVRWLCLKCHAVEHSSRGRAGKPTYAQTRSHCALGHSLSGDNLFFSRNQRLCRICSRDRQRLRSKKRRAEQQPEARA